MGIRTITFLLCSLLAVRSGQGWYTTPQHSTAQECGGTLTALKGEFTSPNYPGLYPNNAFCQWLIMPNGGKSVYLKFTNISLENQVGCMYDSVSVYDGPSTSYPLLVKLCGQWPRSVNSSGPYLTVVFQSDSTIALNGFHAEYEGQAPPVSESCRNNCGNTVGNCSCSSYCSFYGNCCDDYHGYCGMATDSPYTTAYPVTSYGSCRYNCGNHLGSCSCTSSCRYYGNCCHDYNRYCQITTDTPQTTGSYGSCRYNCGSYVGSCSCTSYCHYYGDCCHDYNRYCGMTTNRPDTTAYPTASYGSCRYNCGYNVGSCSCTSSCRYYGNCCHDYNRYCGMTTNRPYTTAYPTASYGSCRYNCGYNVGSCSCTSSCRYYGNCCHDYNRYCGMTTNRPDTTAYPTTSYRSCRYYCGYNLGSCSCTSSCQYYGNCCHDYNRYCGMTTNRPYTTAYPTASYGSCRYNCGYNLGSCSCTSSCQYYGNCCHDYNRYCGMTTDRPYTTAIAECGGRLQGSGSFSSPNYPNYYHDNAYCVWHISAPSQQQVVLTITDVQLENCCSCDYIAVYDGPSLSSQPLGKICYNNTTDYFHSSSSYLTVLFRSDSSMVSRGFRADYTSSLSDSAGRVDCSSDNMNIVIQTSYLNSMGYSGHDLYLNDQYCRPSVSSYQVVFSFPLNTCGTRREFRNGRIVYTNGVRAYRSQSGEITRQSHFTLQVLCRMEQDSTAQIMYMAREDEAGNITGRGRFNLTMGFFTSGNFYYPVYDSPYVVTLNQYLYVQVKLRRSDSSLVLFLDTCVASPSPHDFHTRSYDLVRNGCRRDSTYYQYSSGTRDVAQFRFQAFTFMRSHSAVYLQCKVAVCRANDYNSRCSQGCQMRKTRSLRSTASTETATVTLGPIQLRDLKKPEVGLPEEGVVQTEV